MSAPALKKPATAHFTIYIPGNGRSATVAASRVFDSKSVTQVRCRGTRAGAWEGASWRFDRRGTRTWDGMGDGGRDGFGRGSIDVDGQINKRTHT